MNSCWHSANSAVGGDSSVDWRTWKSELCKTSYRYFPETQMRYLVSLRPIFLALSFGLFAVATPLSGQSERKVTKLADGVYEIQHPNTGGNVNGNTTVIIGERQ